MLFLEVLAFWFVLRWLLFGRLVPFAGRALIWLMLVGTLDTLSQHHYLWAGCFAGSALLAWLLLRRWRGLSVDDRVRPRLPRFRPWRGRSADEVATLCEQRIGLHVDAAAPAALPGASPFRCVLALAGDGIWVLEDDARFRRPELGRVLACWDRASLVALVEHSRRGERLQLSWP